MAAAFLSYYSVVIAPLYFLVTIYQTLSSRGSILYHIPDTSFFTIHPFLLYTTPSLAALAISLRISRLFPPNLRPGSVRVIFIFLTTFLSSLTVNISTMPEYILLLGTILGMMPQITNPHRLKKFIMDRPTHFTVDSLSIAITCIATIMCIPPFSIILVPFYPNIMVYPQMLPIFILSFYLSSAISRIIFPIIFFELSISGLVACLADGLSSDMEVDRILLGPFGDQFFYALAFILGLMVNNAADKWRSSQRRQG